jgi:Zn finger protein HypA/HybF involved in hydrogenase expression
MNLRTALGKALFVTMLLTTFAQSHAQDIETLLMPGKVIEGHAEVEAECSSCHKSFNKSAQRDLCMDCHEDVAGDVSDGS